MNSQLSSADPPKITVIGYPGDVGGANTECWHTVKLWRDFGAEVTLIPTWTCDPSWKKRLDEIGCKTIETDPENLTQHVSRGDTVIGFCNAYFLSHAAKLQEAGCRTIWVNCMERISAGENRHYEQGKLFDRYVFQSRHQAGLLMRRLERLGLPSEHTALIRGAFDVSQWPYIAPSRSTRREFVIGRISRADPHKFARRTWDVYGAIRDQLAEEGIRCRVRILGWSDQVEKKLGKPPAWAQCLPVGAISPQEFMRSIDCMIQLNGGVGENWPRTGLEAMASGIPLVVPNRWGWSEMIKHADSGLLAENDNDVVQYAVKLALHPVFYRFISVSARREVRWVSNPGATWSQWKELFDSLRD